MFDFDGAAEAYWARFDPAFEDDECLYEEEEEEDDQDRTWTR